MRRVVSLLAATLLLGVGAPLGAQVADYRRAEALLDANIRQRLVGDVIDVQWLPGGDRFRYSVRTLEGAQPIEVDPATNATSPLSGLARPARPPVNVVRSPDGRWDAFIASNDVYVRPAAGGDPIRLTTDGTPLVPYGYGYNANNLNPRALRLGGIDRVLSPVIVWAPDSRRLVVQRADNRGVKTVTLYSSTTVRPTAYAYPYAMPGDSVVDTYSYIVLDIETRTATPVQTPPIPNLLGVVMANAPPPGESGSIRWSPRSDTLYLVTGDRGGRRLTLIAADARTGGVRDVVGDTSADAPTDVADWEVTGDGRDIFWFSWRDGWGHFYRFDGSGRLKNRVTAGAWTAEEIVHVDVPRRQLYITARGREPDRFLYHSYLYRVNFDGTGTTLLTPEVGDHEVRMSPSGRYVIDTYSQVDVPPITVLRRARDGAVLRTLARADISRAVAAGFTPPRVVRMTAADGATAIYGIMHTPSDFDPAKRYPVVDYFYGAPGAGVSTWGFMRWGGAGFARALAELGAVVVEIAGRGTSRRSKAFLDAFQGQMGQNTLPDHVAGIRDLARQYPFLDTTRVGIYGESRGGFGAAAGVLRFPEFFKVAVAASGDHDNRMYRAVWGERFQGPYRRDSATGKDNYEADANYTLARNLKGKLLLIHGDMDDNVHPASTLRLVHALIAANKKFDLMVVPDGDHGVFRTPYVIRLTLDYFVTHLIGATPPDDYIFGRATGGR